LGSLFSFQNGVSTVICQRKKDLGVHHKLDI
jgi:hypothetical protein